MHYTSLRKDVGIDKINTISFLSFPPLWAWCTIQLYEKSSERRELNNATLHD